MFRLPITEKKHRVCEVCLLEKHCQQAFSKEGVRKDKEVLELIHTDVCDPMNLLFNAQNMYFILFIDDLIHMIWVNFMRQESEVFMIFKKFKAFVVKQSGKFIKKN